MSCAVAHRHGSDLALLWLWHRPVATALIQPLAREPPCAVGAAIKKTKKKKKGKVRLYSFIEEWRSASLHSRVHVLPNWPLVGLRCHCNSLGHCYGQVSSLAWEFPHTMGEDTKIFKFKIK